MCHPETKVKNNITDIVIELQCLVTDWDIVISKIMGSLQVATDHLYSDVAFLCVSLLTEIQNEKIFIYNFLWNIHVPPYLFQLSWSSAISISRIIKYNLQLDAAKQA